MSWSEFEEKPEHPSRGIQLVDDYLSAIIAQLREEKKDPSKRTPPCDSVIRTVIIGEMLMSSDDD